jgi:hypothetical protein
MWFVEDILQYVIQRMKKQQNSCIVQYINAYTNVSCIYPCIAQAEQCAINILKDAFMLLLEGVLQYVIQRMKKQQNSCIVQYINAYTNVSCIYPFIAQAEQCAINILENAFMWLVEGILQYVIQRMKKRQNLCIVQYINTYTHVSCIYPCIAQAEHGVAVREGDSVAVRPGCVATHAQRDLTTYCRFDTAESVKTLRLRRSVLTLVATT